MAWVVPLSSSWRSRATVRLRKVRKFNIAGWRSGLSHQPHKLKIAGSNPAPATKKNTVTNSKICDMIKKERRDTMLTLIKIRCPVCGKWLFDADVSASGMISAYCKRCKAERLIELKGKA